MENVKFQRCRKKSVDYNYGVFIIKGFYMFLSEGTNFRYYICPKLLRKNTTYNSVCVLSNFGCLFLVILDRYVLPEDGYLGPKRVV